MNTLSDHMFEGFSKPEANFFRLPNERTDITAKVTSLAEMKLVEYVLKHTWGYSEFDVVKKITTDEFMYGRKKKNGERIDIGTGQETSSLERPIRAFKFCNQLDEIVQSLKSKAFRHRKGQDFPVRASNGERRGGVLILHIVQLPVCKSIICNVTSGPISRHI